LTVCYHKPSGSRLSKDNKIDIKNQQMTDKHEIAGIIVLRNENDIHPLPIVAGSLSRPKQ